MKWYEVAFVIIFVIVGAYLRGKIYEHKTDITVIRKRSSTNFKIVK